MSALRRVIGIGLLVALWPRSASAQRTAMQPNSARDCAVCHLPWIGAFQRPEAVLLTPPPGEGVVSDEHTCLGCHDGSVADSRRRVWLEHGHRTGVVPSTGMSVPTQLPLTDGKLACRTCHSAHSGAGPETLANTVFIRVPNESSQLCQMCHSDYADGAQHGRHPLGRSEKIVPDVLLAAGARTGPDKRSVTCQTCHTPHGGREGQLLVMGFDSGELCLTCHAEMRPGMFRPDVGHTRSSNPPLNTDDRVRAIHDLGTRAGMGETLICSSCHKMHDAVAGRFLLAESVQEGRLCLRCHSDYAGLLGSTHDLRQSAPHERNRFDQTADQSGPCMACHGFHQYARKPDSTALDSTGLCVTCHQEGQCAAKATGLPFSHPNALGRDRPFAGLLLNLYPALNDPATKTLACLTCHDAHETKRRHYLRREPDTICASCHPDQASSLAGAHDLKNIPDAKNARGLNAAQTGTCGFCHAVHGAVGSSMWVATNQPPRNNDAFCTECHRSDGLASKKSVPELRHPTGPQIKPIPPQGDAKIPLFDDKNHRALDGFVACASCHNPHGGKDGTVALLRTVAPGDSSSLCTECHRDTKPIHVSLHSSARLAMCMPSGDSSPIDDCRACHRSHAAPGMASVGMWVGPLGSPQYPADMRQCLGCHGENGGATRITPRIHPAVALQNLAPPGSPGFMPLAPDPANPGADGRITCRTCHLPHGRDLAVHGSSILGVGNNDALRAVMPMMRPYVAPNLCSTCHGFEGLSRFLYYHAYPKPASTVGR